MSEQQRGQDPGLAETVDQPRDLWSHHRFRNSEAAGHRPGYGVGAGPGVHEPDQAQAGHRDPDTADGGGGEEGRGARCAQHGSVGRRRHGASFTARRSGPPGVVGVQISRPVVFAWSWKCRAWCGDARPTPRTVKQHRAATSKAVRQWLPAPLDPDRRPIQLDKSVRAETIVNGTTSAVRRRAARRRSETGTETAAFGYVEQLGFRNGGSLSGGAVGPFSEQVRVSRVAGGRFDEVERDPGHRERLTVLQGSDRLRLAVRLLAGSCWALEVNTGGSGAVRVSRLVGSRAGTCRISLPWSARRHPRTKLPRRARAGAGPPRRAARHRCRA